MACTCEFVLLWSEIHKRPFFHWWISCGPAGIYDSLTRLSRHGLRVGIGHQLHAGTKRNQTHYVPKERVNRSQVLLLFWKKNMGEQFALRVYFCMTARGHSKNFMSYSHDSKRVARLYIWSHLVVSLITSPTYISKSYQLCRNIWCRSFKCYAVARYWSRTNNQDTPIVVYISMRNYCN
jgi:hypothetical protein